MRYARNDMLAFMQAVWWMPNRVNRAGESVFSFKIGRHTRAICDRLTRAVEDWQRGRSTYLLVNIPFRHGKSDIVSRAFPPYFLGHCAAQNPDVIMSGYGADLVEGFSRNAKAIIRSDAYRAVFPGVEIDPERDSVSGWGIRGSMGTVTVAGLGGAITGKGGHLIILDDYCKNREEAYSETYRDKTWQSFSVDLMTRQNSPAAIVIVCATPWHLDDVTGRIKKATKEDPEFPPFEELCFPARKPGEYDILFPEMYGPEWYSGQRASLGPTAAAALLDCNPVGDGTRMFRPEWFRTYERAPDRSTMNVYVIIDSANSKKKTSDYTTMLAIGWGRDRNYYVLDGIHERLNLSERTEALFGLVERWHPLNVFWEQVGAMSDAQHVRWVQDQRSWHFPLTEIHQNVPKEDRVRWLQPAYEAGRVWWPNRILRTGADDRIYDLTADFENNEFLTFPICAHDDIIDCLANIQHPAILGQTNFPEWQRTEADDGRAVDDWSML